MKIRDGFISIISLIVMSVAMLMVTYLLHTTNMESLILNSTSNNIQSYYLSEGKIIMSLYEDKYYLQRLYPALVEYFRGIPMTRPPTSIMIDEEDLEFGDKERKIDLKLIDKDNRKYLRIDAKSDYRGLKTQSTSMLSLINEVFEIGNPILDIKLIDIKYKEQLENIIEKISNELNINSINRPESMYCAEFFNFNDITLYQRTDGNYEVELYRDTMEEPFIERFIKNEVFIAVRNRGEDPINFFIGNPDKSNRTIKLSGIIYVEGNIIISSKLEFNGIIVVKNGDIEIGENIDVNVTGLMITDNIRSYDFVDKINMRYHNYFIYKYGTYLPGFIEPIVYWLKSN